MTENIDLLDLLDEAEAIAQFKFGDRTYKIWKPMNIEMKHRLHFVQAQGTLYDIYQKMTALQEEIGQIRENARQSAIAAGTLHQDATGEAVDLAINSYINTDRIIKLNLDIERLNGESLEPTIKFIESLGEMEPGELVRIIGELEAKNPGKKAGWSFIQKLMGKIQPLINKTAEPLPEAEEPKEVDNQSPKSERSAISAA